MPGNKKAVEKVDHAKRLQLVLAAMGIKRATFVDDQFSPSFDDAWARSRTGVQSKTAELAEAWGTGRWEPDSGDDDRPDAEKAWNARSVAEQIDLYKKIVAITAELYRDQEAIANDSFFRTNWPMECPLDEIGPEKFTEDYIKQVLIAGGPSLLFLDLSLGHDKPRGGIRLLKQVLALDPQRTIVCVVFTRSSGANDPDFWTDLAKDEGVEASLAVAISQGATQSLPQFEAQLRRALLNSLAPELVKWGGEIAKQAVSKALAAAVFEGDVLNAVVLQSSEREGVHPTETLFRLIDEAVRTEREQLVAAQDAQNGFKEIRAKLEALAQIAPIDDVEPALTHRVRELMRRHLYRPNVGTPDWPSPLWLGDIWEVAVVTQESGEKIERYVLIAQPCDIILRSDGTRSQEWVILAPLKSEPGRQRELVVELKYSDEAKYGHRYAYLKKARVANANVLDAVALFGSPLRRADLPALRKRGHVHTSVRNRMNSVVDWAAAIPPEPASAPLLSLFLDPGPRAKLTNTAELIDFHAKRIERVEPELARLLLQRYGNFVSRNALPHDFAEFDSK